MKVPIAKDGYKSIGFLTIASLLFFVYSPALSTIPFSLLLFTTYSFRDPNRKIVSEENDILSPADGTVMEIKEVNEPLLSDSSVNRISIFLSPFNVHINRSPIYGNVTYVQHKKGKFFPAFMEKSDMNEKNLIKIENQNTQIMVKQIAGIICRRVVCKVKAGDYIASGQRLGMIKFGSRVDLYIPKNVEILIEKWDKVIAGKTVLGRIKCDS